MLLWIWKGKNVQWVLNLRTRHSQLHGHRDLTIDLLICRMPSRNRGAGIAEWVQWPGCSLNDQGSISVRDKRFCGSADCSDWLWGTPPPPSWEAKRSSAIQEILWILWNPKVHYHIHKCHCNIILPLCQGLPSGLLPLVSPSKCFMRLSCPPYMPHTPPISLFFIWSPEYLVRSTEHESPCYVFFSTPLSPCAFWS